MKVAFFGGQHRREPFMRYVFPALCRLAASRPVTLFAVGIDLEGVAAAPQLTVAPVAYNPSYPEALRDLAVHDVDILVHPSSDTLNNLYKNPHFLINARALGATPFSVTWRRTTRWCPRTCACFARIPRTRGSWPSIAWLATHPCGRR